MTALPSMTRFTGANTFTAMDAAGTLFYAFQRGNADVGALVMVKNGIATDITPAVIGGRPCLEVNPVGLWLVGNKETGASQTPPRYPIAQYVPFRAAIPADGAIAALYTGVYVPSDLDTPAEIALRVQKQLDAIQELVELLKRAGVLR